MISLINQNGHANTEKVVWSPSKLKRFERAYKLAIKKKVQTFIFDHHEFDPAYAGYLIEYLKGQFK